MTSALARRNSGVQAGSVDGATSTAPAGMASPAAGSRATKAGPRAWPAATGVPRQLSAPGSIPASAPRAGRPARRRRFPPPRPDLPRPPIVAAVSCATRRAGPPPLPAARRRPGPAIPRRSGGTHRRARPGRRGRRSVRPAPARSAWRRRRSRPARCARPRAGGSPTARRRSAAAPAALPARQRRVQRPPGRKRGGLLARTQRGRVGADQVQHAVQQIIRRFAPARMTQIGFVDGAMAVALQEVREGAAKRAVWRQRVAPVRAAPVGCAQPGQRRRIVAPARPDPSARSSGRPSRWARRQP